MELISYFLSFITIIAIVCAPFCKKMTNVLIFSGVANITSGLSYMLVRSFTGTSNSIIAIFILVANYIFRKKGKNVPSALIGLYMVVMICSNIMLFSAWYDIITIFNAISFVLSMSQKNVKHYRTFILINVVLWLFYDLISASYGNLCVHLFQFSAILISIYKSKIAR